LGAGKNQVSKLRSERPAIRQQPMHPADHERSQRVMTAASAGAIDDLVLAQDTSFKLNPNILDFYLVYLLNHYDYSWKFGTKFRSEIPTGSPSTRAANRLQVRQ